MLFLGNIIMTGWWKVMADRTRHPAIVAFAQRQVTITDFIFTAGGSTLIFITGITNAILYDMDYLNVPWLFWGIVFFSISGLIWVFILIPIQIKQARMAKQFAQTEQIPDNYWHLSKLWIIFGTLATLLPLANLYWMVFKPV